MDVGRGRGGEGPWFLQNPGGLGGRVIRGDPSLLTPALIIRRKRKHFGQAPGFFRVGSVKQGPGWRVLWRRWFEKREVPTQLGGQGDLARGPAGAFTIGWED